jgi:hypothetical protein
LQASQTPPPSSTSGNLPPVVGNPGDVGLFGGFGNSGSNFPFASVLGTVGAVLFVVFCVSLFCCLCRSAAACCGLGLRNKVPQAVRTHHSFDELAGTPTVSGAACTCAPTHPVMISRCPRHFK